MLLVHGYIDDSNLTNMLKVHIKKGTASKKTNMSQYVTLWLHIHPFMILAKKRTGSCFINYLV